MGPTPPDSLSALLEQFAQLTHVRFAALERAWLAAPLALILLLAPLVARRTRPKLLAVALRAVLLAILTAVLLEPTLEVSERLEGDLLVVADVSPSVGSGGVDEAKALLERARAEQYGLVAFGATPQAVENAGELAPDARPHTDIGSALRFAAARAAPDAPTRVVLISDGRATEPGAEQAARRLRSDRVELWAVGIPRDAPSDVPSVSATDIELPAPRLRREPFTLTAKAAAAGNTHVTATLYLDGKQHKQRTVELKGGINSVLFDELKLEPGRYHAQVLLTGDRTPNDNLVHKTLVVPGTPKVLFLGGQERKSKRKSLMAQALAKQGFLTEITTPAEAKFDKVDVVVILPDAPVKELERRTADLTALLGRGGGLLTVGGSEGAGLARFHASPTAGLLPVEVEPRDQAKKEKPAPNEQNRNPKIEIIEEDTEAYPISVCIVIDSSGSMQGRKMRQAKAAAAAAAKALTNKDRIAVVAFGETVSVVMASRAAGNEGAVRDALAELRPAGRTPMFAALSAGYSLLDDEPTPIRHLILISDGIPTDSGRWRDLVSAHTKKKITLSTVGIGFEVDNNLLGQLAQWGSGMYWITTHPHRVPQVVTQDTMRVVEARNRRGKDADRSKSKKDKPPEKKPDPKPEEPKTKPLPPETVPILPDPGAPREMFLGLEDEQLPGVAGVEKGKLRFASWAAARAGEGGPVLLAYQRAGLGTSAALMVDPEAPGAKALREHEEFTRLMAQLVRSVLPDVRGDAFVVTYELTDRSLAVEVLGEDGLSRTDLPLGVTLDGEPLTVRRRAGRFEMELPDRAAVARIDLRVGPGGKPLVERSFVVPASRNEELAALGVDRARLLRLTGDAEHLDAPVETALMLPVRHLPVNHPLALPFLLLAAILLPLDAWARRRASR